MNIIKKIVNFFKALFGFKKEEEGPYKTLTETMKEYHDKKRSEYSDFILKAHYYNIKRQVEDGTRSDETLAEYVNELEYRGLKYD